MLDTHHPIPIGSYVKGSMLNRSTPWILLRGRVRKTQRAKHTKLRIPSPRHRAPNTSGKRTRPGPMRQHRKRYKDRGNPNQTRRAEILKLWESTTAKGRMCMLTINSNLACSELALGQYQGDREKARLTQAFNAKCRREARELSTLLLRKLRYESCVVVQMTWEYGLSEYRLHTHPIIYVPDDVNLDHLHDTLVKFLIKKGLPSDLYLEPCGSVAGSLNYGLYNVTDSKYVLRQAGSRSKQGKLRYWQVNHPHNLATLAKVL